MNLLLDHVLALQVVWYCSAAAAITLATWAACMVGAWHYLRDRRLPAKVRR